MGKALKTSGITLKEMSEYLDYSRNGVSAWVNDRTVPRRQTLMLWAIRTGTDLHWLLTGHEPGSGKCAQCAARDSNPEPAGKGTVIPFLRLAA